jgi:GC-rich sequence DNA-binding factor
MASLGIRKAQDTSLIPDQATINAIRAKRERLRQSRAAAPDFISLDGGSNHGEAEGLSDEKPEFHGRIALFGEKKTEGLTTTTNTTKKGVFEDMDERPIDVNFGKKDSGENDNDDEDDEEKIWEEEQFRKGLGKRMEDGTSRVAETASSVVPVVQSVQQQQQKFVYPAMPSVSGGRRAEYRWGNWSLVRFGCHDFNTAAS